MKNTKTLIGIQDEYVETVNLGIARYAHMRNSKSCHAIGNSPFKGHAARIAKGAHTKAEKQLRQIGFTDQKQINQIIADARDMAALERMAE
jgi:hypothetical protein